MDTGAGIVPEPPRLLARVRDKIRLRHYSIRTEQAYVDWIRRFILFHGKRHPAALGDGTVSYIDLALDLWVSTDGTQTVLDQDEFETLQLEPAERAQALAALRELQALFNRKRPLH